MKIIMEAICFSKSEVILLSSYSQIRIMAEENKVSKTLDFFMIVGQIKTQLRTGWTHHGVKKVESVSDHMYRMAIMTMVLEDKELNKTHCMKMALVHDLAECIVGDITPFCGISPEEKRKRETDAMEKICGLIENVEISSLFMDLFNEYNAQESVEAKAVKDLDRFEMILQAYEYEKNEQRPVHDLQIFFNSTKDKFRHSQVKSWVEELNSRRNAEH